MARGTEKNLNSVLTVSINSFLKQEVVTFYNSPSNKHILIFYLSDYFILIGKCLF